MRRNEKTCAPCAPPNPWGPRCPWGMHGGRRPPRHWFFFRIFLLLFVAVFLALIVTLAVSDDGISVHRFFHFLLCTALILFVCFFVLRWMFSPMRRLMHGVQEISNGNLNFKFEAGSRGEVTYLAETFNVMVERVREMVQSKSQLLLDVSHELRSPLTRLKVALEMVPKHRLKNAMLQDIVEMETMLAEILETEQLRSDHGKLAHKPLDIGAVAADLVKKYRERKPGVKLLAPRQNLQINADEARVKTVLQNVLENALKYSAQQKRPVQMSVEAHKAHVVVTIQDFGVGIPDDEQEKIFEPFYRVDKSRTKKTGGYGLGLSLCREIMQAHGGEIALQSKSGKGTKAVLTFPK